MPSKTVVEQEGNYKIVTHTMEVEIKEIPEIIWEKIRSLERKFGKEPRRVLLGPDYFIALETGYKSGLFGPIVSRVHDTKFTVFGFDYALKTTNGIDFEFDRDMAATFLMENSK